jgi:hypothetical protein
MFNEVEHLAERGMRYFYIKEYENAINDFEDASTKGKVPNWMYILAARAYATQNKVVKVLQNLQEAQSRGWHNWEPVIQSDEIQQLQDSKEFRNFLRKLQ